MGVRTSHEVHVFRYGRWDLLNFGFDTAAEAQIFAMKNGWTSDRVRITRVTVEKTVIAWDNTLLGTNGHKPA